MVKIHKKPRKKFQNNSVFAAPYGQEPVDSRPIYRGTDVDKVKTENLTKSEGVEDLIATLNARKQEVTMSGRVLSVDEAKIRRLSIEQARNARNYVKEQNERAKRVTRKQVQNQPWTLAKRLGLVAGLSQATISRIYHSQRKMGIL